MVQAGPTLDAPSGGDTDEQQVMCAVSEYLSTDYWVAAQGENT